MKKDYTDITFVLDRSGSMSSVWDDVIGGLKTFLQENKKVPGEVKFSLVVFDSVSIDTVIDHSDLRSIENINLHEYKPRGGTPLYDALGKTINDLGRRLSKIQENDRPDKVLFVVMTDGYENASREFRSTTINNMVTHQTDKYNWDFVYLGANQNAILAGSTIGFSPGNSISYSSTPTGTLKSFDTLSSLSANYRCGRSLKGEFFNKVNESDTIDDLKA